jgi:transcriptional regulator with XRE-family HTH domain
VTRVKSSPEWVALVGERLHASRRRHRLKLREVADATGLDLHTISRAELGRNVPSLPVALRLSICYGVSLDWVCGRGEG